MGEKWFEFVKRIKKDGNHASLSDAMKEASKRKSEWNGGKDNGEDKKGRKIRKRQTKRRGGYDPDRKIDPRMLKGSKSMGTFRRYGGKKRRASRKTRKGRKGRKTRKSRK